MTEFKIVSAVKNTVTSQRGVTGSSLRNDQIADEVDTLRARLIGDLDSQNRFKKPYQGFTQKIEFTVDGSKKKILPKILIKEDGSPAIAYVGGKAGQTAFRVIYGATHAGWIGKDEDIASLPTLQVEGEECTFINFPVTELMMIAVFEDPSACEDYGYNDETSEYPMPAKMQDIVIGKTSESFIRQMFRIPPQPNNQVDAPQLPRK